MGDDITKLIAEVQRLHNIDARHKGGFRLSDRTPMDALLHAIEELTEVGRAGTLGDRKQELGDVLGCLIHYAIKAGISLDAAARSAMEKLKGDFEPQPNPDCEWCQKGIRFTTGPSGKWAHPLHRGYGICTSHKAAPSGQEQPRG